MSDEYKSPTRKPNSQNRTYETGDLILNFLESSMGNDDVKLVVKTTSPEYERIMNAAYEEADIYCEMAPMCMRVDPITFKQVATILGCA